VLFLFYAWFPQSLKVPPLPPPSQCVNATKSFLSVFFFLISTVDRPALLAITSLTEQIRTNYGMSRLTFFFWLIALFFVTSVKFGVCPVLVG